MAAVDKHAARFQRRLARAIEPYRSLLVDLVYGEMSPGDFEMAYMSRWGGDKRWMEDAVFEVGEEFFFVVEDYVDNPDLRDPSHGDLGPDELRERARELLRRAGFDDPAPQ